MIKLFVVIIFILNVCVSSIYAGDFSKMENDLAITPNPMESVGFKEYDTSWTNWNKFWFAGAVVGNTLDTTSTIDALNRGCIESNPLLGEQPSDLFLVGFKVAALGISWLLVENVSRPQNVQMNRNLVYGFHTIMMNTIAIKNYNLECH